MSPELVFEMSDTAEPKNTNEREYGQERLEIEAKILVAALKQSVDDGDLDGANLAARYLGDLLVSKASKNTVNKSKVREAKRRAAEITKESPEKVQEKDKEPQTLRLEISAEGDLYRLLNAEILSSFKTLHIKFLSLIKCLVSQQSQNAVADREFRLKLRNLCIAHDVLCDPVTRADYDLRLLCSVISADNQASTRPQVFSYGEKAEQSKTRLKLGELLYCAQILDASELAIAIDMHKAVPEMMFGEFMVSQGYLNEEELKMLLQAQQLIGDGVITVAQFQIAMKEALTKGMQFEECLKSHGWAISGDILPV